MNDDLIYVLLFLALYLGIFLGTRIERSNESDRRRIDRFWAKLIRTDLKRGNDDEH